ncbi:hypothetical protein AGLY_015405 [Aphis glycines]|uniref:C2H2-type domain-containing protein n=1 Tax=Aphis glycines TaxID=307491 RepID=A0A6G0T0I4_APHGL|nr:hypothetical protein AGLY_015405 [Aphis glycines]
MIKMDKKDTTDLCFICEEELVGNGLQFDFRRTHIGNELLTQKIAELIGDHFVVIVNNNDRMCKDCVALLNNIDEMETELTIVKNALLLGIKNKYGLSVDADDKIEPIMVEDGVLKADRSNSSELEQVKESNQFLNMQHQKVPTPPKVFMPRQVPWPQQILRPQLPQQILRPQLAPRLAQSLQRGLRPQLPGKRLRVMLPRKAEKKKQVYNLQTKRQLFQNDVLTHSNKIDAVKCDTQNTSGIFPVSQPKQIFKCKICIKYFIKREVCLRHIQECHNKPAPKQVFKCKICVKYFIKREVCLRHIQEYHDEPASIVMETKPCKPALIKCTPQPKFQLNNQEPESPKSPRDDKKEVTEEKEDAAESQ